MPRCDTGLITGCIHNSIRAHHGLEVVAVFRFTPMSIEPACGYYEADFIPIWFLAHAPYRLPCAPGGLQRGISVLTGLCGSRSWGPAQVHRSKLVVDLHCWDPAAEHRVIP